MTAARILVVDDEADISTILTVTLRRAGYEVASAADGIEAIEAIHRQAPDLILLDVMMPRSDGLETLKRIRQHPPTAQVPVIMLTARAGLADKMKGFERGADDYVAKPFEARELSLRIANILKRAQPAAPSPAESVRFGPFLFHIARGELRRGEELVHLTDREKDMLRLLAAHPGETVPRLMLAGNGGAASGERAVDVQVNRLRRKIENDPANPLFVQTVRGIGYRLMVLA